MAFHSEPAGKGGAGSGDKLSPSPVRYGDALFMDIGSYSFGFGGGQRNHCIAVVPFTQPTGPDPLRSNYNMVWSAGNQYTIPANIGRFFDAVDLIVNGAAPVAAPGTAIFKNSGATEILRVESTLFPTEHAYYLIGVCANLNAPAGPLSIGKLLDYRIVFLQKRTLSIYDAAAAGIDTATLDIALALAGHNVKMRDAVFIDGVPATRRIVNFGRSLYAGTTPSLDDPDSDEGLAATVDLTVTSTPDAYRNVQQDITST